MKIIDKLNKVYIDESDNYREKAVTLYVINQVLALFFLLFSIIRITKGDIGVAAGEAIVTFFWHLIFMLYLRENMKSAVR